MDEHELRARWEKRLGEKDRELLDFLWEDFDRSEIQMALDEPAVELDSMVRTAKEKVKYWRLGRSSALSSEDVRWEPRTDSGILAREVPPVVSWHDWDRSDAFSEYLHMKAADDPLVVRFRREVLGRPGLPWEQVWELARSPAAACFPASWFGEHGVPVVGHSARVEFRKSGRDEMGPYEVLKIHAEPPGVTSQVKVRPWLLEEFAFPGEDGFIKRVKVLPGSVLGELLEVGRRMVRKYPWSQVMAMHFVLTGRGQAVLPLDFEVESLDGEGFTYATINLRVEPWVSADAVRDTYRRLQKRILGKKKRNISERNVAVLFFVVTYCNPRGPYTSWWSWGGDIRRPKWSTLCERWNRDHPKGHEWHYEYWQNFQRDFGRARKALVDPDYNLPDR